ncbi:hypothetical protein N0V95_003483 [Ascochyta clinopodiicola]|nr:hypothetical protein N0V95_003483 [Ascochyta clinopodiicola]
MSTRSNRFSASFQPLRNPSQTIRNFATSFSPTRSSRSASATSYSSTSTTSPLTHAQSRNPSGSSYSRASSPQSSCSRYSLAELLAVRRRPSTLEFEMAMESRVFGSELSVLEPRPVGGESVGVVGIFEVLDGKF